MELISAMMGGQRDEGRLSGVELIVQSNHDYQSFPGT